MAASDAVRVDGLQPLRKSLRKVDRDALKKVQQVSKSAARIVALEARRLAPRGTRPIPSSRRPSVRLADSYQATTSGSAGVVRSRVPHAVIYEYRKTGTPAQMRGVRPVSRAIERKTDEVMDTLERGIDDVLRSSGWR